MRQFVILLFLVSGVSASAFAEIVSSGPDRYELRHEALVDAGPELVWERLIHPEAWWNGDHTFSGDAANLSLDAIAGGLWREDWDGGSVAHGRVLACLDGKMLRLDAPFGPLQGMAVNVVWTISLEPAEDGGTRIIFVETAIGTPDSKLDDLAPAVDGVKHQAIKRLASSVS